MLMKSGINPFDSQEAKPYKNDPEILAMTNLVSAYQVCKLIIILLLGVVFILPIIFAPGSANHPILCIFFRTTTLMTSRKF